MHDQAIDGEVVSVELVSTAREAITQTMRVRAANPLAAQQLQSLLTPAQLQEMQLEQRKLAEQVAAMRAAQRKKEAAAAAQSTCCLFDRHPHTPSYRQAWGCRPQEGCGDGCCCDAGAKAFRHDACGRHRRRQGTF